MVLWLESEELHGRMQQLFPSLSFLWLLHQITAMKRIGGGLNDARLLRDLSDASFSPPPPLNLLTIFWNGKEGAS